MYVRQRTSRKVTKVEVYTRKNINNNNDKKMGVWPCIDLGNLLAVMLITFSHILFVDIMFG